MFLSNVGYMKFAGSNNTTRYDSGWNTSCFPTWVGNKWNGFLLEVILSIFLLAVDIVVQFLFIVCRIRLLEEMLFFSQLRKQRTCIILFKAVQYLECFSVFDYSSDIPSKRSAIGTTGKRLERFVDLITVFVYGTSSQSYPKNCDYYWTNRKQQELSQ